MPAQFDANAALDIDALAQELARRGARIVGIDGPGGSGKTTLARVLAGALPGAHVVEVDDFQRPICERVRSPADPGGNVDLQRLLTSVLEPVQAGLPARYRRYDWTGDRLADWREVPAGAVVVVEGVYSMSGSLRERLDYAIWVDCPYPLRLRRGIDRDGEEMRSIWTDEWMPAEERYLEAERPDRRADLLLDGAGAGSERVEFKVVAARG